MAKTPRTGSASNPHAPDQAKGSATVVSTEEQRLAAIAFDSRQLGVKQLGPLFWLAVLWAAIVAMLYAVGYLDPDPDAKTTPEIARLVALISDPDTDYGARRAARAYSGITLALTVTAALLGVMWACWAFFKKGNWYRIPAAIACSGFLGLSSWLSWKTASDLQPFTSALGKLLLEPPGPDATSTLAKAVPYAMFYLACIVPSVLLAGATFQLQPMQLLTKTGTDQTATALGEFQIQTLMDRIRELDQMLYIGALTLVFGTLQLSAGLSITLVSMPKAATVKTQADICKLLAPAASAPAFYPASEVSSTIAKRTDKVCEEVPKRFSQVDDADSLRQLARGITLCFGLAFSGLLAAVYVPGFIGLRKMIEERLAHNPELETDASKAVADGDPMHRLAALAATLGPSFAGLLANTLAG